MKTIPSPFPGMDPYLEGYWSDVHVSLCAGISEAIQPHLPPDLRARNNRNVLLQTLGGTSLQVFEGDGVILQTKRAPSTARASQRSAVLEPVIVSKFGEEFVERWVQIVDIKDNYRVVTIIEILSPGNKESGELNKRYLDKINQYIDSGVSVVELDLLRSSRKRLIIQKEDLPRSKRMPYLCCVHRAGTFGDWEAYPISLREPLPLIPIPLREQEQDVLIELQPIIRRAYSTGGHDDIDYTQPSDPPLEADDAAWANDLLVTAGRR